MKSIFLDSTCASGASLSKANGSTGGSCVGQLTPPCQRRSNLSSCLSRGLALIAAILFYLISCSDHPYVHAHQITDIPPLTYVNRFRTWTSNQQATFRPGNATYLPLLPHGITTVAAPRIALHSLAVVSSTKRVVCFGGMIEALDVAKQPLARGTNATYIYDPPSNVWYVEPLASRFAPPPRVDHASWAVGDYVFVHGGENETVMADTWRYFNRTWRMLNFNMPNRTGHTIDVVDPIGDPNTAYLFGGMDNRGRLRNELFAVSVNGTVKQLSPLGEVPSLRAYHASAVMQSPTLGPMLLVHGGYDGFSGLKDLFVYYLRKNRWVRINSGVSESSVSFSGDLVPSITLAPVYRHSCQALWPTLFCMGGTSSGDPVSFEFDVILNRYVEQFFNNPSGVLPLVGHKTIQYINASNHTELLAIGGYSGVPSQFIAPMTVFKTDMQMDSCPDPYINPDWLGTCVVCPRGSGYFLSVNPHRCVPCPKGTFSDSSRCQPCPSGTYNTHNASSNVSSCVSCPRGYFTVSEGSYARHQCVTCQLGTYASNGKCQSCPPGTYGTMSGAMSMDQGCVPCPYGSYSDVGSTSCTTCPPGTSGPAFIKTLDPYQIVMQNMGQTVIGQPPGGCPQTSPLSVVYNDNWFWVTLQIRDFGELGATSLNPYYPIDIAFFQPGLRLYAFFRGNPGKMYYNCRVGQEMFPGCSYVTENQTTPLLAMSGTGCGFNGQSFQFALRFTSPAPSTTLHIRGDGLRGVNYTFQVVNNYQTVSFSPWPSNFVVGQPIAMQVYAWLNNALEPSSSFSAKILVQCLFLGQGTGTSLSPTYTVNGGSAANTQTVNIVNGTALIWINFAQFASGCVFKSQDQFGVITQPNSYGAFSIQKPFAMYATLLTKNTSNWGVIHVQVRMVDAFGNTVTGDNTSEVLLTLWTGASAIMQPAQMVQRLVNGQTVFSPVVHSLHPLKGKQSVSGKFRVIHLSGLSTLMTDNITQHFATHHVNGTTLRLVNYSTAIPSFVSVNTTLNLEIEHVNRLTGEQDSSRDVWVQVQMVGCGSRITPTNHSHSVVRQRLPGGHGIVSLFIQGYDSNNCRLNVFEYITGIRIAKGFTTQSFNVISPRVVVRDGCKVSQCATCTAPYAGQIVTYNISVQTWAGVLAPVNNLVVRVVSLGNRSAAIPADGVRERRLVAGNISVPILYLPSMNATGVRFEVGTWTGREVVNFTYYKSPTFIRKVKSLGVRRFFILNTAIQPTSTCMQIPRIIATSMVLTSTVPVWTPQDDVWTITMRAVNDYGVTDSTYSGVVSTQIQHCEQGVYKDLTVQSIHPQSGVVSTLYSPATASNAAPFVTTSNFIHGQGVLIIRPRFTTDSDWNAGVRRCEVSVASPGLRNMFVAAPEFRKTYPSCDICPPGYWSSGGDGRNTSSTFHHPGGCMPCAVGTFSAYSGATSIQACAACQTGYGFWLTANTDNTPKEGAIQCTFTCPYSTGGQAGGGPCAGYTTLARTDVTTNRWAQYGRSGKVCTTSSCLFATSCPNGKFYVNCPALSTQATCEDPNNVGVCVWNAVKLVCMGQVFNCVPCPAGTVGTGACTLCTMAQSCAACDAGGWSSDLGHTTVITNYNLAKYRCTGNNYPTYNRRCSGPNTGQCPNGTYSTVAGAYDNSTCLPCPKGFYCYQVSIYTAAAGCPPSCSVSQQSPCGLGCTVCPYTSIGVVGNFKPIPCPVGTYNNRTGGASVSACRMCPSGTSCPAGSIVPTLVDPTNFLASNGKVPPSGITFGASNDVTSCTNEASSDAQGYVQDGRFTNFVTFWSRNGGANYVVPTGYVEYWGGKSWSYSPIDRLGNVNSGSILMNATGAIATQKIILRHELPIEMVARVWVQYNLYVKNITKLKPNAPRAFCGLSLGVHYTDGNEMDSFNYTGYAKPFSFTPPTVVNSSKIIVGWYLVEILIQPKRPVRWIQFSMLVQGYYWGTARFDDASLKPSHRRICNCSSGFYFNQSEKSSRVCRLCPPGFACSGGTMSRCVNSWSAVGFAGCQFCYDGWECDADGRGRQIPCALYNRKDNGTETCSPCPLGYACKDGQQTQCDNGFYGDGGLSCVPCQPGYYSLPGAPRWQCDRCPPGTTSVAARWYCTPCTDNHYSSNGTQCLRCPNGEFAPSGGANACRSCSNVFLDHYNLTVSRNHLGMALRVVPSYCEPFYKFQVERVVSLSHGYLGVATPSRTSPSVLYSAGPAVGVQTFRVFVTSGYLQPEQYADVQVRIVNNPPVAADDTTITFPHPRKDVVHALATLMSNDYDPDLDDIFFATVSQPTTMTQFYAFNATISADRKTIFISLPANFTGPAHVQYTLMDQFHTSTSACLPPSCLFSAVATATFWCVDAYPVAVADFFSFPVGQVYSLDVLANDYDIDGDQMSIYNTSGGSLSGIAPAIQKTCPTCPGSCSGPFPANCSCYYDAQMLRCYPSNKREYFLDYTANTGVCGNDTFSYKIQTIDGTSIANATVLNTRCYCMTKTVGFNMIFLLDGTQSVSDFGFQVALADAVSRRSSSGTNFYYGMIEVGTNRVIQNLSNVYFNMDLISRASNGNRMTYTLGQGLRMAAQMITTYGTVGLPTYIVIVSSKPSYDNAFIWSGFGIQARFMTVTVNSQMSKMQMFADYFKNPYYDTVASSYVALTQNNAKIAEEMMDLMCSS